MPSNADCVGSAGGRRPRMGAGAQGAAGYTPRVPVETSVTLWVVVGACAVVLVACVAGVVRLMRGKKE